jgi:hypothetical protein
MQTRAKSIQEQIVRIVINYCLSVVSYSFLFPGSRLGTNFLIGIYFVCLPFIVGYMVRRLFNND